MKHVLLLCLAGMLIGCKEITYREPQPKGVETLHSIPKALHGKYLLPEDSRIARDTLVIESTSYYAASERHEQRILSDSLIFKYYKGFYFVNIQDHPEWLLRVFQQEKNGDIACYMLQAEDSVFNSFIQKLSRQTAVDSTKLPTETLYQIDPSPKKLLTLIKEGYFQKTAVLRKVK